MSVSKSKNLIFILVIFFSVAVFAQKELSVQSPDNSLNAQIKIGGNLSFKVECDGEEVITIPKLAIELQSGEIIGENPRIRKVNNQSVKNVIEPVNYKRNSISNEYNELNIRFKDNYSLEIRAYNEGLAYRFITSRKDSLIVLNEPISFEFPENYNAWLGYSRGEENKLSSSFQSEYDFTKIPDVKKEEFAFLPIMIDLENGNKLCITEVNIESYPGMFVQAKAEKSLAAKFAPYPALEEYGKVRRQLKVKKYDDFIVKISGQKTFPWRVFVLSENDIEMADNDLVYKLAAPSKIEDISWIKPGKIAWD